ncbi:MAG: TrkA family potassium uptake protein [Actinomycetes bacterium]
MHVVIMGCGRVGATLANRLDNLGHSVAIIDQEPAAFRRLHGGFRGETIKGIGFDRGTLEAAGTARAEAFAAVSSGDNSNILAARVARETFGVENVVARIYDPKRAEVYQRLGIPTVATVSWTSTQMMRRLIPSGAEEEWTDSTGAMVLAEIHVGDAWVGQRVLELAEQSPATIGFVTRRGEPILTTAQLVIQEGDLIHALFRAEDRAQIELSFAAGPGAH